MKNKSGFPRKSGPNMMGIAATALSSAFKHYPDCVRKEKTIFSGCYG